ncbi:MAG: beta-lactamase family protein [Actinomycetota bacterium]|nr:beta-lactamase family protein [Actinomycetota bacterium]
MDADRLAARLAELCGDGVPGASVALTDGATVVEAVHGVTSLRTKHPVTPQTLFQIGSITKVYTATLVMALVDQGKVDLDASVQTYLPSFQVADSDVAARVTIRHLLTHTSGFEGDDFTDTGRGDDALRLYVERLAKAAQIHPIGAMFSYCNSGFSTLGLVVEQVTGMSWDQAVQEMLAEPLGLTLATLAEQVILQPHALGHLELPTSAEPDAQKALQVAPVWAPPRSVGPAGTICSSAADVIAFGKIHAADGAPVLTPASVLAMQQDEVLLDDPWPLGRAWGLGWILPTPGVIGHDGATFGQYAFYRLHPESGAALALLTNGPGARAVFEGLYDEFFAPLAGVGPQLQPTPATTPPAIDDLDRYVGDYERQEVRIEVRAADGGLDVTPVPLGPTAAMAGPAESVRFVGFDGDTVVTAEPLDRSGVHVTAKFLVPDGQAQAAWIHFGARATPRKA